MSRIISPGVFTREFDQTFLPQGVSSIGAVIIGPTEKGPANIPVTVNSQEEFDSVFGGTTTGFYTNYAGQFYLKRADTLSVVRVLPADAITAIMSVTSSAANENSFEIEALSDGAYPNDEFEVIITTGSANFTLDIVKYGTSGNRVPTYFETFRDLSMDPNNSQYINKVIGDEKPIVDTNNKVVYKEGDNPNNSKYIRIKSTLGTNLPKPGIYKFQAVNGTASPYATKGTNGTTIATPHFGSDLTSSANVQGMDLSADNTEYHTAYEQALDILKNDFEYDFNLVATPGIFETLGNANSTIISKAIAMCEDRGDAFYVFDAADLAASRTPSTVTSAVSSYDTNYAATYVGWSKVRDASKNKDVYVPASTLIPSVFAYNDSIGEPWFAPAGFNRGGITEAKSMYVKYTRSQIDVFQEGRVNPLASFPNEGVVAWGQKTLQKSSSALDRINVRRLLIEMKKFIASTSKYLIFEPNVQATRTRFLNIVNPYFESVQQRKGITGFSVVMDETNNTEATIDRNELRGAVYIKPSRSSEYFIIDFNLMPTGATFDNA